MIIRQTTHAYYENMSLLWLLTNPYVYHIIYDFDNLEEDDKLVCVLDRGCKHASILKAIMKMWSARFY